MCLFQCFFINKMLEKSDKISLSLIIQFNIISDFCFNILGELVVTSLIYRVNILFVVSQEDYYYT